MKKKGFYWLFMIMVVLSLAACGGNDAKEEKENDKPVDLTGDWKQVNNNSEDSYQRATIRDGQIEIFWVNESGESESLYWAGTYATPETAEEPYTWDSVNDKEKTNSSLLASGDDTKTFTYEDGQISYSASAFGTTQTVRLEKQK